MRVTGSIPGEFVFQDGGGTTLALLQNVRPGPVASGGVEVSFETVDVQGTYLALKSRGVVFRTPPRAVTEDADINELLAADFRDPDRHALSITWLVSKAIPGVRLGGRERPREDIRPPEGPQASSLRVALGEPAAVRVPLGGRDQQRDGVARVALQDAGCRVGRRRPRYFVVRATFSDTDPKKALSMDSIFFFFPTASPSWPNSSGPLMCA